MESKLPFGLKNGLIVEVSQVERGLECGCICPVCKQALIARKGTKTVHHFAHYKAAECAGAAETALHQAAKDILERNKKINLPAVMTSLGYAEGQNICLYPKQILHFRKVFLEKRLDNIIPDIIIQIKSRQLIIEITVTHAIDIVKMNRIRKLNISTLEIDLSKEIQPLTLTEFEKVLIYDLTHKYWIYNSKREAFLDEIRSYGKALRLYYRNVYKCPFIPDNQLKKNYTDLLDDCFCCDYLIHANGEKARIEKNIICAGHAKKEIDQIVSRYKN